MCLPESLQSPERDDVTCFGAEIARSTRVEVGYYLTRERMSVLEASAEHEKNRSDRTCADRSRSGWSNVASVVDQSDGRTVIRISGPRARDALAKGVLIDLHSRAFHPGDTALTVVSYFNVHFWQLSELPEYEFTMFRSFATAFSHWLMEAASEYGLVDIRRNTHSGGYFSREK